MIPLLAETAVDIPPWVSVAAGPLGAVLALIYVFRVILPKKDATNDELREEIKRLNEARFEAIKNDHDIHHETMLNRIDSNTAAIRENTAAVRSMMEQWGDKDRAGNSR